MQSNYPPSIAAAFAGTEMCGKTITAISAGSDQAEVLLGMVGPAGGHVIGAIQIVGELGGTLTANDTSYVTITVFKRTNGGSTVTLGSATTKTAASGGTGNWTAWVPINIPVTAGAECQAGDIITASIIHTSSGVAVPQAKLSVFPAVN